MTGRIGSYTHSDSITENKGCAVVKVECQTDFAAKTQEFKAFVIRVARLAYGANQEEWIGVIEAFPELEDERKALAKKLKETVEVSEIAILRL